MQLSQTASMRQEMRQLLTPRMIQSMEILQLPLMALEERIEQELVSNPVLEMREGDADAIATETAANNDAAPDAQEQYSEGEQVMVVEREGNDGMEDFERLEKIADYLENEEFGTNSSFQHRASASYDGERDKKLDALNNSPDRAGNLTDYLTDQWTFVECSPEVRRAGLA